MQRVVVVTDLDRLSEETKTFACKTLENLSYNRLVEVVRVPRSTVAVSAELFQNCVAVITRPTDSIQICREYLSDIPGQIHVFTVSIGKNHIKEFETDPKRYKVVNSYPYTNARGVAAFNLMLASALFSELQINLTNIELRRFEGTANQTNLLGKSWLVLGAGDQAARLLELGHASGVEEFVLWNDNMDETKFKACLARTKALGHGRWKENYESMKAELTLYDQDASKPTTVTFRGVRELDRSCSEVDIISLHMPHQSDNDGVHKSNTEIVNKALLNLFTRKPILINTSRGELLNEDDVLDALRSERLRGVAVDVLYEEIERTSDHSRSRLWSARLAIPNANIIITPHISGAVDNDTLPMWQFVLGELTKIVAGGDPVSAEVVSE